MILQNNINNNSININGNYLNKNNSSRNKSFHVRKVFNLE